jgi:vacuolar-type H+-ATPase subunit H
MVTAPEKTEKVIDEIELVVEEFKLNIVHSIQKERDKAHDLAEKEANSIIAKAYQEAAGITDHAREESTRIMDQARANSQNESAEVLRQTHQQSAEIKQSAEKEADKVKFTAQQIYQQAHEELSQVQKLTTEAIEKALAEWHQKAINMADSEAIEIVNQARVTAQQEKEAIFASTLNEAKQTLKQKKSN